MASVAWESCLRSPTVLKRRERRRRVLLRRFAWTSIDPTPLVLSVAKDLDSSDTEVLRRALRANLRTRLWD